MFKIRIRVLTIVIVFLYWSQTTALELDSAYLAEIQCGMDLAFIEEFDSAKAIFEEFIAKDSTDHAAYLFLAGVYHAEMIDREDYSNKPTFTRLNNKAIKYAELAIKMGDNPAWAYLTMGNAHGYVAALEGKEGSWWVAVKRGIKAKNNYLKALERDPTLYDAYLGLGTYHYWKSAKTDFINWLPLVKDRKQQGLAELQLVIDSSLFSSNIAANSLIWIYNFNGNPHQALEIARKLREKFPESRMATWGLAFSSYYAGRYREAIDCFGELIDEIEIIPDRNYFNLIECRYHRARMYQWLKQPECALEELALLLNYSPSAKTRKRQEEKLKKAHELRIQIEEQLEETHRALAD